jgi:cytochrome c oxidase subunit 3
MTAVGSKETKRIHPHKFTLWVAMGSICMMFAAFTSAYIVKRNQSKWLDFDLPSSFWISTLVILISSFTVHLALQAFKAREMKRYRSLITITAILGISFSILQFYGFSQLNLHGVQIFGQGSNAAASFLGVIVGFHVLHVLGGVIAIMTIFLRAYSSKIKNYSSVPIEMASTYWHFVDLLWIYLFIFFMWIR